MSYGPLFDYFGGVCSMGLYLGGIWYMVGMYSGVQTRGPYKGPVVPPAEAKPQSPLPRGCL